jgi:hypothetical protein
MENENPDRREKGYILMRAVMDFGMGLIILCCGLFFLIAPGMGWVNFEVEPFWRYFFAGLCLVYGGWRVYRGYKKNYFH